MHNDVSNTLVHVLPEPRRLSDTSADDGLYGVTGHLSLVYRVQTLGHFTTMPAHSP